MCTKRSPQRPAKCRGCHRVIAVEEKAFGFEDPVRRTFWTCADCCAQMTESDVETTKCKCLGCHRVIAVGAKAFGFEDPARKIFWVCARCRAQMTKPDVETAKCVNCGKETTKRFAGDRICDGRNMPVCLRCFERMDRPDGNVIDTEERGVFYMRGPGWRY